MATINKDMEAAISQEMLKERLHYDRETGVFTWLDVEVNGYKVRNKRAGCTNGRGYVIIGFSVAGKPYILTAHRLAWLYEYGEFPSGSLDHINHDRTDNRMTNLRIATQRENLRNQSMYSNNTTAFNGVHLHKPSNKYQVRITVNNKQKHLGLYDNIEDAAKAAQEARAHYGYHENHGGK